MTHSDTLQPKPESNRATVQLQSGSLVKRQLPEQSRIERERTELGAQIAAETGLFDVPEMLSYDDAKGEIAFRYIHGAVPLRKHLARRSDPQLMLRVGRALAVIHGADVPSNGSDVFWHGDYGMRNVLYSEECDRITVIDCANASWVLEPAERFTGNPGLDLGVALISLFHQRPMGYMYVGRPEPLGTAFLQGYRRERRCFRVETVLPFISDLIRRRRRYWISQRGFLRNLAHDPSLIRLHLFLSRVESRLD